MNNFIFFNKSGNHQAVKKIKELLQSISSDPYTGTGQPEALKHQLSGAWSRRITREHRLVYEVKDDIVMFYHCEAIIKI